MPLFDVNVIHKIDKETRDFLASLLIPQTDTKLDQILSGIQELKVMNTEMTELLTRLDAASNEVAADIQTLIDRANESGSLTAAEIAVALGPKVAFLEQLGASTNAPIPEVPPPTE